MLLAFWSGYLVCRYASKPISEKSPVKAIQQHVNNAKEAKRVKKLTFEEIEDERKSNTFYS